MDASHGSVSNEPEVIANRGLAMAVPVWSHATETS
jgi:hypothetical protein